MLCFLLACSLHMDRNVVVSNENDYSGSGVILSTGLVLTNAHLVGEEVYVGDEQATVVKIDRVLDLALLKVETRRFGKLKFGKAKLGKAVYYVGNPGPLTNAVSRGFVVFADEEHIFTDTLPIPGMSGGGLYNRWGHLIGLDEGYVATKVGVHLAIHIPAAVVRKFLEGT